MTRHLNDTYKLSTSGRRSFFNFPGYRTLFGQREWIFCIYFFWRFHPFYFQSRLSKCPHSLRIFNEIIVPPFSCAIHSTYRFAVLCSCALAACIGISDFENMYVVICSAVIYVRPTILSLSLCLSLASVSMYLILFINLKCSLRDISAIFFLRIIFPLSSFVCFIFLPIFSPFDGCMHASSFYVFN